MIWYTIWWFDIKLSHDGLYEIKFTIQIHENYESERTIISKNEPQLWKYFAYNSIYR